MFNIDNSLFHDLRTLFHNLLILFEEIRLTPDFSNAFKNLSKTKK